MVARLIKGRAKEQEAQDLKKYVALAVAGALFTALAGCGSPAGEPMSKKDLEGLKNPQKEMPKEAAEAMANAGRGGPPQGAPADPTAAPGPPTGK
ncbi:MAG: hypothetical protein KIS66_14090 [Fimbriimonadaceae bacterium]|nr:hypothetical protein [Fimbriimonadaceae bacterium]